VDIGQGLLHYFNFSITNLKCAQTTKAWLPFRKMQTQEMR
jgi:hypothetical protein